MRILAVADKTDPALYDHFDSARFPGVELILACGDLDPEYLSFLVTVFQAPLFYVRGNHDKVYEKRPPEGCTDISGRLVVHKGWRIAGLEGSNMYKAPSQAVQYTQRQMTRRVLALAPRVWCRRGLDIVITHAPPLGVHDREDQCHRGIAAWHRLIKCYRPQLFIHGHSHLNYGRNQRRDFIGDTEVIDAYCHVLIDAERRTGLETPPPARLS